MTNQMYDALKFVAQILLPALGTLYFALAELWGLPNPDEVVGTIVAVDTFLGVLLGLSSKQHRRRANPRVGTMAVTEDAEGAKSYSLNLDVDPYDLDRHKEVTFKVERRKE